MNIRITLSGGTVKLLGGALQQAYRLRQVRLIKQITALLEVGDGVAIEAVAERLGVGRLTVYGWVRAFVLEGEASLHDRRPTGRPAKLTATEKRRLCELIAGGLEAAGYATGCWNSSVIQALIEREFDVLLSVHYVCDLLRNLGFSYQKARFVSDHLDKNSCEQWRTHRWPTIVAEARRRKALLLFADEASFAQWGSLGSTWARRRQQPVVQTTGKRKGYKVFGLIDYFTGRVFSHGQTERFTTQSYCAFLAFVLAATDQPLIIIQDGARYHTAKHTRAFVAAHAHRLQPVQLPPYSPDYNPIEHLWRNVKRRRAHNRYFPSFEALMQAVDDVLATFKQHPEEVKRLMGAYFDETLPLPKAA